MKRRKEYAQCWNYLKESRIYFLIIFIIFLISFFVGLLFPVFLIELIGRFIEEIVARTEGMSFFQLIIFILQNNITTAFVGLMLGIGLGLFPLFLSFLNGYVLGFVANLSVRAGGIASLWCLLPHGVFELPALIISLGLGLKMARFIFAKNKKKQLGYDLANSLRVFLFIIIPLLLIAAIIEAGLIFLLG